MRWELVVVALTSGCGATVDGNTANPDAAESDGPLIDAPVAPPDARICAGGDSSMSAADGSCIVLFTTPRTFAAATAACIQFGSTLAILTTPERDAVAKLLVGTRNVYIGLSDLIQEGVFVWVDGTPLGFSNFAMGEPNNANGAFQEDCAMYSGQRGAWDDRPCAPDPATTTPGEYAYLCMY